MEKLTVDSVKGFETEVDYTTVLDNFEGPLDLLLHLIKQRNRGITEKKLLRRCHCTISVQQNAFRGSNDRPQRTYFQLLGKYSETLAGSTAAFDNFARYAEKCSRAHAL